MANPLQQKTVNTPCAAYDEMKENWRITNALLGGTKAMRAAAEDFLPKEPGESVDAYKVRLSRTFLFPGFGRTVKSMTGLLFRRPMNLQEDVPEEIQGWCEDVDLAGRHINVFTRDLTAYLLSDGICHVHVDYPKVEVTPGQTQTLADERATGARPYFRLIRASELIDWWSTRMNGKEVLTELRLRETERVKDGEHGEAFIQQVRILRPGAYEVFQLQKDAAGREQWVSAETGRVSLDTEIPFFTIYAGRTGFMTAEPPMMDLAYLNLAHWQSSSDQRNILRVTRVPMLFGSGMSAPEGNKPVTLSANRAFFAKDPQAKLGWIEHQGASIQAGRQDLIDLKEEMAMVGVAMLVARAGNELATNRMIAKVESDSWLEALATAIKDGLELGLQYMAKWKKINNGDGGSVEMNKDFGISEADMQAINTLLLARQSREISRETFWAELKRRNVLSEDFDAKEEEDRLTQEPPEEMPFTGEPGTEDFSGA